MRWALRQRGSATADVEVVVTGMGQAAAAAAATTWVPRVRAVVVSGVAGGTGGTVGRGDVVVASRLVDGAGVEAGAVLGMEVPGAMPGTVASVDCLADDPAERGILLRVGAVAVETEAAAWAAACAAEAVPLVVVRGVLDTPQEPLGAAAELVAWGATGPSPAALLRMGLRPRTWPGLLRLGRAATAVGRRTATVTARVAAALPPPA